jgi:hypothetical protein
MTKDKIDTLRSEKIRKGPVRPGPVLSGPVRSGAVRSGQDQIRSGGTMTRPFRSAASFVGGSGSSFFSRRRGLCSWCVQSTLAWTWSNALRERSISSPCLNISSNPEMARTPRWVPCERRVKSQESKSRQTIGSGSSSGSKTKPKANDRIPPPPQD